MAISLAVHTMRRHFFQNRAVKPALLAVAVAQALVGVPLVAQAADNTNAEIRVFGRPAAEPRGYTASHSVSSTGMALSLRETPQSVSVITQQRIQDQGLQTLDDIMINSTGVTLQQYDNLGRITYRSRGFKIGNFKIDGLNVNYENDLNTNVNIDLFERVEVIHGANGLLGGTGDPSATVNLVRKQPGKKLAVKLGVVYGRWDKKRIFADVNAPLAFDGRVRSRFVISAENSGSFLERAGVKKVDALANFDIDLTDSTLLNFGVQYDSGNVKGNSWGSNVPVWYADGSVTDLPRSTNPVPDWAHSDFKSTTFFASVEQHFADNWKTKLAYSHNQSGTLQEHGTLKVNQQIAGNKNRGTEDIWGGFWTQDGKGGRLNATYSDVDNKEDNIEWTVNGLFNLFGRTHELMAGLNGYRTEKTSYTFDKMNCGIPGYQAYRGCQYRANGIEIADWRGWNGAVPGFVAHRTDARTVDITTNYGGYIAGRFSLADPVSAIVGVRVSNNSTRSEKYDHQNKLMTATANRNDNGIITPYVGILYDINDNYSVYASYTSVFHPQNGMRNEAGQQLAPITGDSYEAGLKSEFFGGRLNASATAFLVQQRNLAHAQVGKAVQGSPNETAYIAGKGAESKGVEFDVSGALTENWNIYFGYTYLKADDPGNEDLSDPRHVMRLFTTYHFPGVMNGLTVGGGVRAQSGTTYTPNLPGRPLVTTGVTKSNSDHTPLKNGAYGLVDLMARYQFNDNISLGVNVNNLFDKKYYRYIGFYDGAIYGVPRSYWATLNISY